MIISLFAVLQSCENNIGDFEYVDSDGNIQFILDDIPFEMQEQTDKLVVYMSPYNGYIYTPALNIFREKYPHVDVEVLELTGIGNADAEAYFTLLKTELMAGKGPDLILEQPMGGSFLDTYKVMDAGILVDLNHFIGNDDEFDLSLYNEAVLDSGIYRGRRFVIPHGYYSMMLLTTQEILDAEKIKLTDLETFDGFMNAIARYNKKYENNPNKIIFRKQPYCGIIPNIFPWSGIELVNYATKRVAFDTSQLEAMLEAMKWSYIGVENSVRGASSAAVVPALSNQDILFELQFSMGYHAFHADYFGLLDNNLTPVLLKYPNIYDESNATVDRIMAIPSAAQNQVNAWNLIKIMLSEEMQIGDSPGGSIPVLKSAAKAKFENAMYGSDDYIVLEPPLPADISDVYLDLMINVEACTLMTYKPYYEFFMRDMQEYFESTKSFDDCVRILRNNLEIYISE